MVDSENVIALAASIVALCALIISIWQGYIARQHHILSVKPSINIGYHFNLKEPLKIYINNNGLGPAIMKKFEILFDGNKIQGTYDDAYMIIINEITNNVASSIEYNYKFPLANDVFPANYRYSLIRVEANKSYEKKVIANIGNILARMGFTVEYECLYGYKHTFHCPRLFNDDSLNQISDSYSRMP